MEYLAYEGVPPYTSHRSWYECLPGMNAHAKVGLYMSQYYENMMNLLQVVLSETEDSTI